MLVASVKGTCCREWILLRIGHPFCIRAFTGSHVPAGNAVYESIKNSVAGSPASSASSTASAFCSVISPYHQPAG
mgnify:CR=1 FL=1